MLAMILLLAAASERAEVTYATRERVWFDRGLAAGLVLGTEVELERNGRPLARCAIDLAAQASASCALRGGRARDVARFEPNLPPRAEPPVVERAQPSKQAAASTRAAIASTPFTLVEANVTATPEVGRRFDAQLALEHRTFVIAGGGRDDFEREHLELVLRDLPLGFWGATAGVDLTALAWARRPNDARNDRDRRARLFVYETSVTARAPDAPFTAGAGRIHPVHAPGLVYLDGVQLGWRPQGTRLEVGVLSGALPDPLSLEPTSDRWLAGGYWAIEAGETSFLANDGRVGILANKGSALAAELESAIHLRLPRTLRVSAALRGVLEESAASLANARVSIDYRPLDDVLLSADARSRDERFGVVGADHAAASATYEGLTFARFTLGGGAGHLRENDRLRSYVSPEISFPALFGEVGELAVGYHEALGFLPGRTAFVQANLRPAEPLALYARLAYLEDRVDGDALRELGIFSNLNLRVFEHVTVRASVLGRLALLDLGGMLSPFGLGVRLAIAGEL
jgi:hypothetical protein